MGIPTTTARIERRCLDPKEREGRNIIAVEQQPRALWVAVPLNAAGKIGKGGGVPGAGRMRRGGRAGASGEGAGASGAGRMRLGGATGQAN